MARYCSDCAAETVEGALFCHRCGRPVAHTHEQDARVAKEVDASNANSDAMTPPADGDGGRNTKQETAGTEEQLPEQTLWSGSYGYRALLPAWILVVLLTLAIGAISMPLVGLLKSLFIVFVSTVVGMGGVGLYMAYRRLSVRYELTNQWFVHQTGLLRRRANRLQMMEIDDVAFGQGPIERWLGVGTIKLISNDPSRPDLLMPGIDRVEEVAAAINGALRAERRRRGLFIEIE